MPDQTKTIISGGGGDYTTLQAWENDADVSGGFWKGEIQDNASYAAVTISGPTGTPTASNYVWLTVASGNRHAGKFDTGKARLVNTSNGTHCITVSTDFTRIEYLQIHQDSTGSSDEGIRITSGVNDVVISRCIILHDNSSTDGDGIYAGNYAVTDIHVDHCIIYGFQRVGIHLQNFNGSNTQTWHIDSCTIFNCGSGGEGESGGIHSNFQAAGSGTNNINVYNTACMDTTNGNDFEETGTGTHNWTGTHNACSDTSLTSVGLTTSAQESLTSSDTSQGSGTFFVVKDLTGGSEDFQLLDAAAGNIPVDNGVDRSASEPDSRQDFSIDIAGQTRGASYDIGASEFVAAGGAANPKGPLGHPFTGPLGGAI